MTFFLSMLILVAGIAIGVGFTQVVCTGMINDTNKMWLDALTEMEKLENQSVDDKTQVFENVTVVANDDDIQWYRQENTIELTYEEWEEKQSEKNKNNN